MLQNLPISIYQTALIQIQGFRLWVSWCWLVILCPQEKCRTSVWMQGSVWERVKRGRLLLSLLLLRSPDFVVAMGTTFFPSRKIEVEPGSVLQEENQRVGWNGSRYLLLSLNSLTGTVSVILKRTVIFFIFYFKQYKYTFYHMDRTHEYFSHYFKDIPPTSNDCIAVGNLCIP